MLWTKQEDQIIFDNLHLTAREIADKIGLHRDKYKVLARCKRLGISLKKDRPPKKEVVKKEKMVKLNTVRDRLKDNLKHPNEYTAHLRDCKPSQCRYTQQTGADMMICGKPIVRGSYCQECASIATLKSYINEKGFLKAADS
jgi:hypothetical protein